ncbi:MAG: sigma-70 family RNA polymerase sigma factor [Candidatus Acidiferrum sp.]
MPYNAQNDSSKELDGLLRRCEQRLAALYLESEAEGWGVSRDQFGAALERGVRKRFAEPGSLSIERLEDYLGTLFVADLALACACIQGSPAAWEHFVREYRGYLRACAAVMVKGGKGGIYPDELADSLFAELYGLADGRRGGQSLFRYFHGRSSLKTWLRAILAQRHVDKIREGRRWESLDGADGETAASRELLPQNVVVPTHDPHRNKYLRRFVAALEIALGDLAAEDRKRVELYYARQKTLAEIGRQLGEHESSVSRNLERARRELRVHIEKQLSAGRAAHDGTGSGPALSDAEIALCFQYGAEDAPIDFRKLFPARRALKPSGETEELP